MQGSTGLTAWGWAAKENRLDICSYLSSVHEIKETSINTPNESGVTPLFLACLYGHEAVARFLIDHGADVTSKTAGGTGVYAVAYASCSFSARPHL